MMMVSTKCSFGNCYTWWEKDLEARQMLPHSATMGCRGGGGGEGGWVVVQSCRPPLAMSSARQVGMGGGGVT